MGIPAAEGEINGGRGKSKEEDVLGRKNLIADESGGWSPVFNSLALKSDVSNVKGNICGSPKNGADGVDEL